MAAFKWTSCWDDNISPLQDDQSLIVSVEQEEGPYLLGKTTVIVDKGLSSRIIEVLDFLSLETRRQHMQHFTR